MTNTRPPGRGQPPNQRRDSPPAGRSPAPQLGVGGDRRQEQPPRRSSALTSILLYGGVALLCLGVGAATFFVMSPPTDYIRREIIARVKAETGRDLIIGGGASFTIFPSLGLRLSGVSLSAPPGMGGEPLLKAANFDVGVRLLPLLRQEIVVDRLELNEPVFSLRVDADGRRSWDMAGVDLPVRFAGASGSAWLADLIVSPAAAAAARGRGAVDRRHPHHQRRRALQRRAQRRLGALRRPQRAILSRRYGPAAAGSGSLVAEGETFEFKTTLTTPQDVAEQRPAKLALTVSGMPLTFSYDGTVGPTNGEGTHHRQFALARRAGALVGQRSVAGSWRGRSRLHGAPQRHGEERAPVRHRSESRRHDGERHRRLRGARGSRARTSPPTSRFPGLNVAELPLGADIRAGRGAIPPFRRRRR